MRKEDLERLIICIIVFLIALFFVNGLMNPQRFADATPRTIELPFDISGSVEEFNDEEWVEPIIPSDPDDWTIPIDVIILAHVINGEAGANWCSDEMMYGVGSVVLNRVNSKYFPNTIEDVVFQKGQYACTWDGNYDKEPCERAWNIAWGLYENGTTWPSNVIFQAQFEQGSGTYKKIQNMYFCWKN